MDNYRIKSLKMRFTYNIVNYQPSGIIKIKNYKQYNWKNCRLLPVHLNQIYGYDFNIPFSLLDSFNWKQTSPSLVIPTRAKIFLPGVDLA